MLSPDIITILDQAKETFKADKTYSKDETKKVVRVAIEQWLIEQDVKAFVSFENFDSYPHKNYIRFGVVRLNNNVGAITKKNNWLNKLIVERPIYSQYDYDKNGKRIIKDTEGEWHIRTHRVRTDPKMLSPFDEIFLQFVKELAEYLKG